MTQPTVPLVDLSYQQAQINDLIREGFNRVIAESSFISGPQVGEFEEAWATYCGVPFAMGVANGTDAIEIALRAVGVRPGDEVILPANTFVATAGAVERSGAHPVLADCDEDFLLDPAEAASKITARTRAVIGVHLYGQAAPIETLRKAVPASVAIVEDMAQAQGAKRNGVRAGALGDVAATSFYPGKNLGAYGDAGAVMSMVEEIAVRVRLLRNHGGMAKYEHLEVGFNSRLDTLQAVVLNAKLALLDEWNVQRREAAGRYAQLLADLDLVELPRVAQGNEHVFHLYVVRVPERDRVVRELNAAGIGAGIHYPSPVHLLPAYRHLGHSPGMFPVAEGLAGEIMSLPLFPGITAGQQEQVAAALRKALGQ
ncbi:DegT/DnrJ/EryC1/StrS family aminotransferase [Pseudarthrobacter phenanthrenivorans]|uniref:DegT/DnrJ/EryC1/StrS family aminotransferase n=1 Tax=Pseudarthrobacter phenanthrenivorans TaxID=361575 RepID=A0A3B0FCD5_PSEPS|nr:DegT/DnrJ/EryC1/StrS family aminotransferase [Pseudarthrobacter phenanthrenivorans]RKO22594.1 DegT/DnrJ/EryC1/StrS family aminotransferase [Pseudarthrobacter phenanthrenivorans]